MRNDGGNALWTALSKLEESEMLLRRINEQLCAADQIDLARLVSRQSAAAAKKAALIKQILTDEQIAVEENVVLE